MVAVGVGTVMFCATVVGSRTTSVGTVTVRFGDVTILVAAVHRLTMSPPVAVKVYTPF
ncbi:MAG: hypothetical protein IPJ51_15035 [Saprospiraceae bacterium]|nr:hypothetical protein [Saprospiraceae bacterium]